MSSKEHWKERAKRMERYRDEVAEQRSQALADLDREAREVDLLRTVIVQLIAVDALRVWGDGRWEVDEKRNGSPGVEYTPDQVEAIDRAKKVISDRNAALQTVRPAWDLPGYPSGTMHPTDEEREMLTAERVARGIGAVPLEELPPDAQERGRVRLSQLPSASRFRSAATSDRTDPDCPWPDGLCTCNAARMHRPPRDPRVPTESRRQEALDEADVNVTLADAATVIRTVRDDLLDPDRPLSLGALALLLGSVLPRIEYQAGCEATIYAALHHVTMKHAIAEVLSTAPGQILDAALAARAAAQAESDAAAREYADLSARQQAAQQNVDYLDALPDDASPGDRLPSVRIGKNDRGAWCVWVDGNLVSDHASRDAAATAARRHTKKSPDALDGAPGRMLD